MYVESNARVSANAEIREVPEMFTVNGKEENELTVSLQTIDYSFKMSTINAVDFSIMGMSTKFVKIIICCIIIIS